MRLCWMLIRSVEPTMKVHREKGVQNHVYIKVKIYERIPCFDATESRNSISQVEGYVSSDGSWNRRLCSMQRLHSMLVTTVE